MDFLLEPLSHTKQRKKSPKEINMSITQLISPSIRRPSTELIIETNTLSSCSLLPNCTLNHCQEREGTHREPFSVAVTSPGAFLNREKVTVGG